MPATNGTWVRPMRGRSPAEPHRASTPLELLFDLSFVVAVSLAAAALHHDVTDDHLGKALIGYVSVFFAIWWAWMNFTWFATAYDTDDALYRVTTLVQMAGVLVLAAGVPRAFDSQNYGVLVVGYVIMRLAMVSQWLRAARSDPPRRPTAVRYAAGITVVQVLWLLRLLLPSSLAGVSFVVLALAELGVAVWAERAAGTAWHAGHITERYGLFTLIVLGESILAATTAFQSAVNEPSGDHLTALIVLAVAGLLIVFSLWWLYFDEPAERLLTSLRRSVTWGYGHYFVFGAVGAVGAGLEVAVDHVTHEGRLGATLAGFAVTIPVAVFLVSVWALQVRPVGRQPLTTAYPLVAVLVLAVSFTGLAVQLTAALLVALVVTAALSPRRADPPAA